MDDRRTDVFLLGAERLGFVLSPEQIRQFEVYYEEIVVGAEAVSLTSVLDREGVQRRHFLEPMTLLSDLASRVVFTNVIDIGSGAGLPGLPMRIMCPDLTLTLLEARGKKTQFLERLLRLLKIADVSVVNGRAEDVGRDQSHRGFYDLAVSRAVAALPVLVEFSLPLLRLGGWLAAIKGSSAVSEVKAASSALTLCGGQVETVQTLPVPGAEIPPTLVLVQKVGDTPDRFPRRPGIPAKYPLR